MANSSSTATVKSRPFSYASRAKAICSSGVRRWLSPIAATLVEGLQQSFGDGVPGPALDRRLPGRHPECLLLPRRQREQRAQLGREPGRVTALEARQPTVLGRVGALQSLGHLGKPGVARDEGRRFGCGGLGRDHPEGLRKDRRDDNRVNERKQVREVPVLERTGEE